MPRRNRQAALPRLILAVAAAATAAASSAASTSAAVGAAAAATSTSGTWSPGTRARSSSHTPSSSLPATTTTTTAAVTAVDTTATSLSRHPRTRRAWGSSSSRAPCRHCFGVGNPAGGACHCFSQPARGGGTSTFAPLWVSVRGGANARVDGRPLDGDRDGSGLEKQDEEEQDGEGGGRGGGGAVVGGGDEGVNGAAAAAAATAGGGGGEVGVGVEEETTARSDGNNSDSSDDDNSNHHDNDDDDDDEGKSNANVTGSDDTANTKNATAGAAAKGRPQKSGKAQGGSSAATKEAGVGGGAGAAGKEAETEAAAAGGEASSASVVQTLELGKVVPALIKQGAVFFMGTWLSKKLSPAVEGQVRAARVIYTAYLVFSQALCMYLRYLIWKKNDDTEMEVPPPAQLKNILGELGKAGAGAGTGEGESAAGAAGGGAAAPSLAPMLDKMMTSKTPVKKYDMNVVQGVRRGQFWASLFMCYTHLRKGMIKPMMLQVSFGMLSLLDSPLFKIYVLGQAAEGDLARPFKKQGLMASLSGPMEGMAAKADEARVAAEAQAAAADAAAGLSEAQAGGGGGGGGDEEDVDDDAMPDIETLTDADDD